MPRIIIWSPLAEIDFEHVLSYIYSQWGNKITLTFIAKIELALQQITLNPKQFPVINKKQKIRKCVLTKQNTLFYRERNNTIELLRIFNTRQSVRKLKYE